MMINNLNSLKEKIETLLFKYNEQKKINQDLETKIEYLIKSNQDLEKKIKVIQAKEKQLKLISALPNESENKQYFKNNGILRWSKNKVVVEKGNLMSKNGEKI